MFTSLQSPSLPLCTTLCRYIKGLDNTSEKNERLPSGSVISSHAHGLTPAPHNRKSAYIKKHVDTLSGGLHKMAVTRADVAKLQDQLASKTIRLEAAAAEAQSLLHQMSTSTGQAEADRQRVAAIVEDVTAKVRLGRGYVLNWLFAFCQRRDSVSSCQKFKKCKQKVSIAQL